MLAHKDFSNHEYVVQTISDGIALNLTEAQIASMLNQRGLVTSRGNPFTAHIVATELYKMRCTAPASSAFKKTLLRMFNDGRIATARAVLLLSPRRPGPKPIPA